jgi:hypothetical protein
VHQKTFYEDILVLRDEIAHMGRDGKSLFPTEVMVIDDETGEILHHGCNMTVLGGRTFLLEQYFGIPFNSTQHLLLNDKLGIPHTLTNTVLSGGEKRSVGYFMIGNGASNTSVPGRYYTPKNYETRLYNPMPFRCVPKTNDLPSNIQQNYRFKKVETVDSVDYYVYYAKKFNVSQIILEYNGGIYVPIDEDSEPANEGDQAHNLGGGSVLSYVEFTMAIEKEEFKEFYRLHNNNSLEGATIDEFGLVLGHDVHDPITADVTVKELAAAELASKFTVTPSPLSDESARRSVIYRVYS